MKAFGMLILSIIGIAVLFLLFGFMVSYTYNLSMPFIFGLPEIGIGQGLALFILAQLLFSTRIKFKDNED